LIKLIVSDMDGTLVDSDHQINNEFWEILEKLKKKKIKFIVASGRQYANLFDKFEGHQDDIIFIAENGAYAVQKGVELFSSILDRNKVNEFIELGRKIPTSATILSGKKAAYIESRDERAFREASVGVKGLRLVDDLTKVEDDILKVAVFESESSYDNLYHHYKIFDETHTVVVSGKFWLDLMNKGVNKGTTLQKVQEMLKIEVEETVVFGDYLNDLEMFKRAKIAFAMENGHEEVKNSSTHRAKSNNENGVVEAIKEYFL